MMVISMSETPIRLIVGLGNPGPDYAATRHNAGFWWVDALARRAGVTLRAEGKFQGLAGRARLGGQEVWLLEPQTYMNLSGQSVLALAQFYKILPNEILVVHDELDLPPGVAKLKQGGGHGGHNGLRDIAARLSTPEFWRLRVGIGHPGQKNEVASFVLKPPLKEEAQLIEDSLWKAEGLIDDIVNGRWASAMKALHTAN